MTDFNYHFDTEPTRKLELRDTECGLIALAVSMLAVGPHLSCLSEYDREALKHLEQRVAHW